MLVVIFAIDIIVIIYEVLIAGIIRRIYVDNIDFAFVSVSESCKGFEVITLNEDVIRCIRIIGDNGPARHFFEYGQFGAQTFLDFLRLVFPHKPVSLCVVQQAEKCRPFFIGQPLNGTDAFSKFYFVSRFHGDNIGVKKRENSQSSI